ncbi:hypothetical protein BO70DRAFT_426995 [Aspergillus heteromorphus CBS 117.55]|uniref:Rhodopsin domain-containing protein n=1 Tax=Aspergillus heteromorphus CBS 117.55 TaxID=1448321 RepID=A0A317WNU8_9EURO|nr:uncharacterized protein BO70DRAFT_426995 [Aspergillus heteromorphus CBS 117.55]PWY88149.1 hypothetical protein BO70DRAFT_426995 [Aspergillus heteromorphus CBS 117.55]
MATPAASDAPDKGPTMLAVLWPLTAFAALVVAVRLYIRAKILRKLWIDDWLITASSAIVIAQVIAVTAAVRQGLGRHIATLMPAAAEQAMLADDIGWIFGVLSFSLPKLAVAALLDRILIPGPRIRVALWGLTALMAVMAVVNILVFITSCNPPRAMWTSVPGATCRSINVIISVSAACGSLSAFTDLAMAIYPTIRLWHLRMSRRKKIALCAVLGCGVFSACAACVKLSYLKAMETESDPTYGPWLYVVLNGVEANLVVLGSCIPTLQPLIEPLSGMRRRQVPSGQPLSSSYPETIGRWKKTKVAVRADDSLWKDSQDGILPEECSPTTTTRMEIYGTDQVRVEHHAVTPVPSRVTADPPSP